jgi:hypothetical protein
MNLRKFFVEFKPCNLQALKPFYPKPLEHVAVAGRQISGAAQTAPFAFAPLLPASTGLMLMMAI